MKSQLISTTCILLFIGVAVAPMVQAEPQLKDEEYVEVQTEFCGLQRQPHTTRLSQSEAEELETYIDSIEQRLSQVETREETIKVFNEAIEEFHRFGLLGGMSVEQGMRLVTKNFGDNSNIYNFKDDFEPNQIYNSFCLVSGKAWICGGYFLRMIMLVLLVELIYSFLSGGYAFEFVFSLLIELRMYFHLINVLKYMEYDSNDFGTSPEGTWLFTSGLRGIERIKDKEYWGKIYGFTGLTILIPFDFDIFFFGTAIRITGNYRD